MTKVAIAAARGWFCILLLSIGLGGCGLRKTEVPVSLDDPLDAKLDDLARTAQPAKLGDLTDFSWDEVNIFPPSEGEERVEAVVGTPIRINGSVSGGGLLVFEERGNVVRAVGLSGSLGAGRTTWPSDVLVEPWGNGALRLTLPPPDR